MAIYSVEWDKDGDGTFSEDISGYVMDVHTDRGRKIDLETMPPGYATLVLNNADGRFSPDKAAGPYYGDAFMYSRVRIKVNHSETDYGLFWGYVLGWDNKPKTTEQTVTWFLGDRFAIWQDAHLNLPLLRQVPIQCALDMTVNRAVGTNECTNPSVEIDTAGYSGLQGVTPVRDGTMKIEGDYTLCCDCPGDDAGEGWRYDATGKVTVDNPIIGRIWVRASESVTLRFRAYDSVGGQETYYQIAAGTIPTLFHFGTPNTFQSGSSHYFELYTASATGVTFWSDGLFFETPDNLELSLVRNFLPGTAEVELAASYRQFALDIMQSIGESEPRSFFFMHYSMPSNRESLFFCDKDYRDTRIAAGPRATFSDDGADVPYHDLILGEDAIDRISEAEVVSQGDYVDENEEVTVWELSPTGQTIWATETMKFRARYSQPARDCSLEMNPSGNPTVFEIEATNGTSGNDGYLRKTDDEYPPDVEPTVHDDEGSLWIGQWGGARYLQYRSYLRWDTSGIPDGATIINAKLKLHLRNDYTHAHDFNVLVKGNAWGAALEPGDWNGGAQYGSFDTADLPPGYCWFEIELDVAAINKTGWTQLELLSDREGTEPTGNERIILSSFEEGRKPTLIVAYSGFGQPTTVFHNYGVGADIEVTAGDDPVEIAEMYVKGKPLKGTSEESKAIAASASPPPVDRTLSYALPLQGSRTASMETEATRLADRYDGSIRRPALVLRPVSDACLTQMLAREIGDLVHLENIASAHGTWIDGDYWIEGVQHSFEEDGSSHETIFYLEEV